MQDLREGAKFIKGSILLYTILAAAVMGFAIEAASVNRPMFLEYHAGADGYVLFILMALIGGVAASYLVGMIGNKFDVGKLVFVLFMLAGVVRIAFTLVVPIQLVGALAIMVIYAALGTVVHIIFSSLNQKIPSKDMVGRVSTISTTFIAIFVALGAFTGGFLGSIVPDAGHIFIYQGISYVVIGVLIIFVPSIRGLPKMNDIKKTGN